MLSAVVHLTMGETLRELHIRIPSPPPLAPPTPSVAIKKKNKEKDKKKLDRSPYLTSLSTFEPDPPKYTGVYKDNHRLRPKCPYFSYISEMVSDLQIFGIFSDQGVFLKEWFLEIPSFVVKVTNYSFFYFIKSI